MDRSADAAKFTGETLAWFDQGEELAASERADAAEWTRQRGRLRFALAFLLTCAVLGFAAVVVAGHFGLTLDLPWQLSLPWES